MKIAKSREFVEYAAWRAAMKMSAAEARRLGLANDGKLVEKCGFCGHKREVNQSGTRCTCGGRYYPSCERLVLATARPAKRGKVESGQKAKREMFDAACAAWGIPVPEHEYAFAPPRKWRFDKAWPAAKVALEIQGGLFVQGRHVRGAALLKEHEKLNEAAISGWKILYCQPCDVETGAAFALVKRALMEK